MDANQLVLEKKLQELLERAASVAAEIQGIEQGDEVPHYDQIETPAHELGKQFSRLIQSKRTRELAANRLADAPCPKCGRMCPVEASHRDIHSRDGTIDLTETFARCRRCRWSFFPSEDKAWAGRSGVDAGLQASSGTGKRRSSVAQKSQDSA